MRIFGFTNTELSRAVSLLYAMCVGGRGSRDCSPTTRFDLVTNPDGSVSLRAHANARLVTADNAGASPLINNRTGVGPWEEFDLIHNADGSVSLRAHANGEIVTADNTGASPLIANRYAIGPWESFDLVYDS
ncbi:hypothetical protein ABIA35_007933 [Catenulispora sp. MAP12-49]|uniref:fascin domain-containing protein n=1 Tax=Catenulispora sp. MAP12-49 TaxID=3156302 RepID=UPI003514CDF1